MAIQALLLDVGGVLLTNGWDHHSRVLAAETFHFDYNEMNARHGLAFDPYESGKLTLDQYLDYTIFYQERPFSRSDFKSFMYAQSQSYPEMLELITQTKKRYGLKVIVLSNEGRELMEHRIARFHLDKFVDFFICSCFVHLRKPDSAMYQLALDMGQVKPENILYIDDRPLLIEIGRKMGISSIQHQSFEKTRDLLNQYLGDSST